MKYVSSALEALKAMARKAEEVNEKSLREYEQSLKVVLVDSISSLKSDIELLGQINADVDCCDSLAAVLQIHGLKIEKALNKHLKDSKSELKRKNQSLQCNLSASRTRVVVLSQELNKLQESLRTQSTQEQ